MKALGLVLPTLLFVILSLYAMVSFVSLTIAFFKLRKFDELQRKAVFDSLAFSMITILLLHFAQLVYGLKFGYTHPLIISPGVPGRTVIGNAPLHFESFFFDCTVIGITYIVNRLRYGLLTKKQFIKHFVIPFSGLLLILFLPFLVFLTSR